MRGIFDIDSPFIQFLAHIADLIILNIVFLICCIPVVTIGPSITALNYVTLKLAAKEDINVIRSFFKSFRQNFRQALIIWILLLGFGGLLFYDLYTLWGASGLVNRVVQIFSVIAAIGYTMILIYVFPVLARFENSTIGTLRSAMVLSTTNFPNTFSMFMLIASCGFLTFYTFETIRWGIFAWLVIGFALIAYFNSILFVKVFAKYIDKE